MGKLLNMTNTGISARIIVQININKHGGFLHRVIHGELRNQQMTTETVDFVFNGILKTPHHQKGNNGST